MGKLPESARDKIPMLAQLDAFKQGCCDDCRAKFFPESKPADVPVVEPVDVPLVGPKCEAEGCEFVPTGKSVAQQQNSLRLHSRKHEKSEEK